MTRTTDPFAAAGWTVRRLGVVMAPDPDDPREAGGVCNPACARGPDGELYLFPRLVAEGNFSRVGRARVQACWAPATRDLLSISCCVRKMLHQSL